MLQRVSCSRGTKVQSQFFCDQSLTLQQRVVALLAGAPTNQRCFLSDGAHTFMIDISDPPWLSPSQKPTPVQQPQAGSGKGNLFKKKACKSQPDLADGASQPLHTCRWSLDVALGVCSRDRAGLKRAIVVTWMTLCQPARTVLNLVSDHKCTHDRSEACGCARAWSKVQL